MFAWEISFDMSINWEPVKVASWSEACRKNWGLKSRRSMVSKIYISNIYVFQIHSMAKTYFEGPDLWSFWKGQNVQNLWPLVQVSKNSSVYQWHTWALGPWILFIQNGSESAPGGGQPPGKQPAPATISGVRPPYVARKGYYFIIISVIIPKSQTLNPKTWTLKKPSRNPKGTLKKP